VTSDEPVPPRHGGPARAEGTRTMTSEWAWDRWSPARPEDWTTTPAEERRYLAPCDCSACAAGILEDVPDDDIVEEEA
jgi:hypothetical protein